MVGNQQEIWIEEEPACRLCQDHFTFDEDGLCDLCTNPIFHYVNQTKEKFQEGSSVNKSSHLYCKVQSFRIHD